MKLGKQLTQFKDEEKVTRKNLSIATKIDVVTIKTIEETNTGNLKRITKLFKFFGWETSLIITKGKQKIDIKL